MECLENVFSSRELLEVLDGLLGIDKPRQIKREQSIEDLSLAQRIESKVRTKLRKKGNYHAETNPTVQS